MFHKSFISIEIYFSNRLFGGNSVYDLVCNFTLRFKKKKTNYSADGMTYGIKLKSFKILKILEIHLIYFREETTNIFKSFKSNCVGNLDYEIGLSEPPKIMSCLQI